MARVTKTKEAWHTFQMSEKNQTIILVGRGKGCYLWAGVSDGRPVTCVTFRGRKTLQALAKAILRATSTRAKK